MQMLDNDKPAAPNALEGSMRDVMAVAASLLPANPVHSDVGWWAGLQRQLRSARAHSLEKDA